MTAVDAFYMQSTMVVAAWQQGAFATVFLILVTAFFILVPVIGSFYTIYAFGRSPSIRLWKWSRPVMVRRIGFVACVAAFLTLAAFSWMPQFRTAWELSRAGQATKASALIDQARETVREAYAAKEAFQGALPQVKRSRRSRHRNRASWRRIVLGTMRRLLVQLLFTFRAGGMRET